MKKVRLRRAVWCLHLALFEQIYCDPHRWQTNNRAIRSMNQQNQATHDFPILPRSDLSRPGSATATTGPSVLGGGTTAEPTVILQHLVTFSTDRPHEASAEFRIGVRSVPYLADHGFQDMVVLPGSFYIEMALCVDRELSGRVPTLVRNVSFRNPIILSAEDTVVTVEAKDCGDGRFDYTFYEAGVENGSARPAARQYAAKLEIDRTPSTSLRAATEAFSIEAFQTRSDAVIALERFYKTMRENGNQYGPRFQKVLSIWRAGDQSLGKLTVARRDFEIEPHYLHPSLLDSVTQLLAPFVMEKGKTFILRSIEKVEVTDVNFPDTLWGHATLLPDGDEKRLLGNVRVFDPSGKPYLELCGVAFTLLDRVDVADERPAANVVIASNFTAE